MCSSDLAGSIPLGIAEGRTFDQATTILQPGDLLLLYTDGVTEAMTAARPLDVRNLFGLERLDQALLQCADLPAADCVDRVLAAVAAFTGDAPPVDD